MTFPPCFPPPPTSSCSVKPRLSAEDEEGVQLLLEMSGIARKEMSKRASDPSSSSSSSAYSSGGSVGSDDSTSSSLDLSRHPARTISMDSSEETADLNRGSTCRDVTMTTIAESSEGLPPPATYLHQHQGAASAAAAAASSSSSRSPSPPVLLQHPQPNIAPDHLRRHHPAVITPVVNSKRTVVTIPSHRPKDQRAGYSDGDPAALVSCLPLPPPPPSMSVLDQYHDRYHPLKLPPLLARKLQLRNQRMMDYHQHHHQGGGGGGYHDPIDAASAGMLIRRMMLVQQQQQQQVHQQQQQQQQRAMMTSNSQNHPAHHGQEAIGNGSPKDVTVQIPPPPQAKETENTAPPVVTTSTPATGGKKFSWKNYPELEDYLIANRSEYLAHASLYNYTVEQKEYNNQLTKRLLEYAVSCGYGNLLAHKEFGNSFTAVRDRIRCYYKSFVQSYRRREQRRLKRQQRDRQQQQKQQPPRPDGGDRY